MSRREQFTFRAIGIGALFGAAVVLSGCVTTVDGRAVAAATIGPLSTTTSTSPAPSSTSAPTTSEADPTSDATDSAAAVGAYTDLPLGDRVWVTWGDDGQDGDADVIVRSAKPGDTPDGSRFLVTVDYECYLGECYYDVDDWTVRGTDGRQHRPASESHFGDDSSDLYDTLPAAAQKRGHLVFDVPGGVVSVEYDARSGDPATWLVPAP